MSKVHFDADGHGLYLRGGYAECGERQGKRNAGAPLVSTDPTEVTCKRCQRTAAYRRNTLLLMVLAALAGKWVKREQP